MCVEDEKLICNRTVALPRILFSLNCAIYKGAVQQRGNDPVVPRVVSIMSFKFEIWVLKLKLECSIWLVLNWTKRFQDGKELALKRCCS